MRTLMLSAIMIWKMLIDANLDDIARASFAFSANHRCSFRNSAQCLAQICRSTHKRYPEIMLNDMMLFRGYRISAESKTITFSASPRVYGAKGGRTYIIVSGCEHLALINIIRPNSLHDLSFDEVSYTDFCHDWDSNSINDFLNQPRVTLLARQV